MSTPKRHHYLPQFYLERFSRDGLLWVFDRETGKFRRDRTQNTAVISQYYSVEDAEGNRLTDIESMLATIEGVAVPIIDKLDARQSITTTEKGELSVFIGFLFGRVPQFERTIHEFMEPLMKRIAEVEFATPERAQSAMEQASEQAGVTPTFTPEEMVDFVQSGEYSVSFDRTLSLENMLKMGTDLAEIFVQMNWVIMHAPERKSFITTDAPFTLLPPLDHDSSGFYGVGMITPGAVKFIPLTQSATLAMLDRGDALSHMEFSASQVRSQNLVSAENCDRLVIGRDEQLVRSVVRATGIEHTKPSPRVRVD